MTRAGRLATTVVATVATTIATALTAVLAIVLGVILVFTLGACSGPIARVLGGVSGVGLIFRSC